MTKGCFMGWFYYWSYHILPFFNGQPILHLENIDNHCERGQCDDANPWQTKLAKLRCNLKCGLVWKWGTPNLIVDSHFIHKRLPSSGVVSHSIPIFRQSQSHVNPDSVAIQAPKVRAGGHCVGHFVHPRLEMLRHPLHVAVQQQKEPTRCHCAPLIAEKSDSKILKIRSQNIPKKMDDLRKSWPICWFRIVHISRSILSDFMALIWLDLTCQNAHAHLTMLDAAGRQVKEEGTSLSCECYPVPGPGTGCEARKTKQSQGLWRPLAAKRFC